MGRLNDELYMKQQNYPYTKAGSRENQNTGWVCVGKFASDVFIVGKIVLPVSSLKAYPG